MDNACPYCARTHTAHGVPLTDHALTRHMAQCGKNPDAPKKRIAPRPVDADGREYQICTDCGQPKYEHEHYPSDWRRRSRMCRSCKSKRFAAFARRRAAERRGGDDFAGVRYWLERRPNGMYRLRTQGADGKRHDLGTFADTASAWRAAGLGETTAEPAPVVLIAVVRPPTTAYTCACGRGYDSLGMWRAHCYSPDASAGCVARFRAYLASDDAARWQRQEGSRG